MLLPCPFCGSQPKWYQRSNSFGTGASGMEAPTIYLRCSNKTCPVRPKTPGGETERWERDKGYIRQETEVRIDQIRRWNKRA